MKDELIGKIIEIAGDYRKGEIGPFDQKHVRRWIDQFQVSEQDKTVILKEVAHMLSNYYISRQTAKECLLRMFKCMKEERAGGCSTYDVNFLRTQPVGKSQDELLKIADEILLAGNKGIASKDCGGSNVYLYLDDCIFSGNKWRYDVINSTQLAQAKGVAKLISYHIAMYGGGYHYAKSYIDVFMQRKTGMIKPFRGEYYRNERFERCELDLIWPQYFKGNKNVDHFIKCSESFCIQRGWAIRQMFREKEKVSSKVFTSAANQQIVEQAFLAVGAKLFCAAQNPAPSMRPMGFEVLVTIGFGTPVVTWRNIPNNAPLALWYGNPAYPANHPLGMWYPLFPRKM